MSSSTSTPNLDAKSYYAQVTAVDIGGMAHELLSSRITNEDSHIIYADCPNHKSIGGRSLQIDKDKQLFHCWGCQKSGDVLQLVEFVKYGCVTSGVSGRMSDTHRQARDFLAAKTGMEPLSHFGLTPEAILVMETQQASYQRACDVLTEAASYYHQQLLKKENAEVLSWVMEKYAFTLETIEQYRIGYADPAGPLRKHLYSCDAEFTSTELTASGLYRPNDEDKDRPSPFFLGRIMFPYISRGRVAYFIGRKTPWTPDKAWEQGKYKKLPVYDPEKRPWVAQGIENSLLFGEDVLLHRPKQIVITEGVTDCIALLARDIPTISPVTTNIRHEDWARIIPKLSGVQEVVICQDNEISGAGWQGAMNTARVLDAAAISCRVAILPLDACHIAARETLQQKYAVSSHLGSRALSTHLSDRTEEEKKEAQGLLEAAKQDVASYFAGGHNATDFLAVMASATSPLSYAISTLSPDMQQSDREEVLDAILRQVSTLKPHAQTPLIKAICKQLPALNAADLKQTLKIAGKELLTEKREAAHATNGHGDPVYQNGAKNFYLVDNKIVKEVTRNTGIGPITTETVVSNFHLKFEAERLIDDGELRNDGSTISERALRGKMVGDGFTRAFSIEAGAYGSNAELSKRITSVAGTRAVYSTADMDDIRTISNTVSGELQHEQIYSFFGNHPTEGFLTPTLTIKAGKISLTADSGARVEIGRDFPKARFLDFLPATDAEVAEVITHLVTDYWQLQPLCVTLPIFAHAFVGPLLFCSQFQQQAFSPYILFVTGSSGKGKTETARLAQCLWGKYGTKERLASWASTPLSNRQQAAKCRGGLWLIDDFKRHRLQGQYQNAVNLLNDYADLQGRGRAGNSPRTLTQEPIRNMLMVTGEDMPYTETSALARSLVVEFRNEGDTRVQYRNCLAMMDRYPSVMPRFIAWWQTQSPEVWLERAEEERADFINFFARERLQGDNTVRLASSSALSMTAMDAFMTFCWSLDLNIEQLAKFDPIIEHRLILQTMCRTMLATVNDIRPSTQFISTLVELLVSGRAQIFDKENLLQLHPDHNARVIGHTDIRRGSVNVYITTLLAEIQDLTRRADGSGMQWSSHAIGKQLAEDGWLVEREATRTQIVVRSTGDNGQSITNRAWALDARKLKTAIHGVARREESVNEDEGEEG